MKNEVKLTEPERFILREIISFVFVGLDFKEMIEDPEKSLFEKAVDSLNYVDRLKERLRRIENQAQLLAKQVRP